MCAKKSGTKRGREAVEISSKGSSNRPITQTNVKRLKRWERAIYLTLINELVNKPISFDGRMWTSRFWVSFTAEFNMRVKESITKPRSLAKFKDFKLEDVMKYGEELWLAYNENKKKKVVMLKDFPLYEKVFKHCDRFPNPSSFSKSRKKPRGSFCFTSNSGTLATTSSIKNGELNEVLDQLSHLRRSGKLCLKHLKEAMNNFRENSEVSYVWLRLSPEDQVMWIKELL